MTVTDNKLKSRDFTEGRTKIMTQKQLRIFIAVASAGTFSGAGEALSISEPAISRSIKALEEEFHCEFFERKKGRRTMVLTDKGSIFFDIARKWLFLIDDAKGLSDSSISMYFRISAVPSLSQALLPHVCRDLLEAHPQLRLTIDSYSTRRAIEVVAENQCDLAFSPIVIPNQMVVSTPLFNEEYRLLCARHSIDSREIALSDLDPQKQLFINWDTDDYVWEYDYSGNSGPSIECRTIDGLNYYLRELNLWCIAPISYAEDMASSYGLSVHKLIGKVPKRTTYMLRFVHSAHPVIEECIDLIRRRLENRPGFDILL